MTDGDDIIKDFLIESTEHLDQLDHDLLELEKDPASRAVLSRIFRSIHTIKGATGFFGFSKLGSVAHAGESLLALLRDGRLSLTPGITSGLLAMVDAVREMLGAIEKSGTDGDGDYAALIELLGSLQRTRSKPGSEPAGPLEEDETEVEKPAMLAPLGQVLVKSGRVSQNDVDSALAAQKAGDLRHLGEILVQRGAISPSAIQSAVEEQRRTRVSAAIGTTIRVDVSQLDTLINLVAELSRSRNQLVRLCATPRDVAIFRAAQHLNLVTTELQSLIMKIRMQPIDIVWNKLPRVVRDLAVSSGKLVRVEITGAYTELDKLVIEAIKDPLVHAVRNSIDHGIETPEQRVAAGKPAEGCLSLTAVQNGGHILLRISDDGAGIDTGRVKKRALDMGLITAEQAASMAERDAVRLIFLPGLSTAAKVTNVSGRGVGMDVVRTNIERIHGAIDVHSVPGRGTTLEIKLPLTLAVMPALIVRAGIATYAIPEANLVELVHLDAESARKDIECVDTAPVYRRRGKLLPLLFLRRELGLAPLADAKCPAAKGADIVMLLADDQQFALVVDGADGIKDVLVRPLDGQMAGSRAYTDATLMDDGGAAPVLDVAGLAQRAVVMHDLQPRILDPPCGAHIA